MKRLIGIIVGVGAVAVAAIGGATEAGRAHMTRPRGNLGVEWGTGAPSKYVASPSFELRRGTGGPPELVQLDAN